MSADDLRFGWELAKTLVIGTMIAVAIGSFFVVGVTVLTVLFK